MPYVVIYVEHDEDVEAITFNDEHGNSQCITDSSGNGIGFSVEEVLRDYPPERS